MPIQRVGVFTLDTSNRRFYTLCGKVHVKLALTVIVFFLVCMELSEWIAFVTVDEIGEKTDWSEALMSILQMIMVICMTFGLIMEQAFLLVPFILFMFLSITSFLIWVLQCMFWVFVPYSSYVSELFGFTEKTPLYVREKCILMLLAVLAAFTTVFSWWLQIGLVCYQYFESRQNEMKTKKSALSAGRPPLVDSSSVTSQRNEASKTSTGVLSFPNQTFTIADDEDEDDHVFEKTSNHTPHFNSAATNGKDNTAISFSNQNFQGGQQDEDDDPSVFEVKNGPDMV